MSLTTPREAFYTPTQADLDSGNPLFWQGHSIGIPKAMMLTFWIIKPGKNDSFGNWWDYVRQFCRPNAFQDQVASGYNDAFETACVYLWFKDPNSPHNKEY